MQLFYVFVFNLFLSLGLLNAQGVKALFPENHIELKNPINYEKLGKFSDIVNKSDFIEVTKQGLSIEKRSLLLFKLAKLSNSKKWKLFFFGQQHGNEPAGKDALIYLIYNIFKNPELLPDDVELWIMPMVNPDGAEKNQRRNANGFDLNRDHQLLSQPETQILHKTFREFMPHIAVDCHEFARDSREYDLHGYLEWPIIMMDYCNNPIFNKKIIESGKRWCEEALKPMTEKGHNYIRYYLGGFPPNGELRHSTPEVDDARNGFGAYGGLSFIIESGVKRKNQNPNADLEKRVDAYLDLLRQFIENDTYREEDMETVAKSREEKLPEFIPTNYFWGNKGVQISEVRVIEKNSGNVKKISTPNFMKNLIVKNSVEAPNGYIVEKRYNALFRDLLDKHDIPYRVLSESENYYVERCKLIRIEDFRDIVYNRYAGRQIVSQDSLMTKQFEAGSIFIDCKDSDGKRIALLLEPLKLYGLYNNKNFRSLIDEKNIIPVWRLINKN